MPKPTDHLLSKTLYMKGVREPIAAVWESKLWDSSYKKSTIYFMETKRRHMWAEQNMSTRFNRTGMCEKSWKFKKDAEKHTMQMHAWEGRWSCSQERTPLCLLFVCVHVCWFFCVWGRPFIVHSNFWMKKKKKEIRSHHYTWCLFIFLANWSKCVHTLALHYRSFEKTSVIVWVYNKWIMWWI